MSIFDLAVEMSAIVGTAGLFFVLLVRPQLRRIAHHRKLVAGVLVGDQVIVAGGLVGRIIGLDSGNLVTVDLGNGVVVRAVRSSIEGRLPEG